MKASMRRNADVQARQSERQGRRRGSHLVLLDLPPAEEGAGAERIEAQPNTDV
jgi:hypothetical protein